MSTVNVMTSLSFFDTSYCPVMHSIIIKINILKATFVIRLSGQKLEPLIHYQLSNNAPNLEHRFKISG